VDVDNSPSERDRTSMVRKMESLQGQMDQRVSTSYDVRWEHSSPAFSSNERNEDKLNLKDPTFSQIDPTSKGMRKEV